MSSVAEFFLRRLVANGCDALYLNSGTDTPALQEAWAKLKASGETVPRLVLCPHEAVAISAAQGYYLATGRAQAVFVHVDVGTANATGGLNDARASNIPVLLCAGASPSVLDSSVPGARTKFINWLQDVPDQLSLVRNYVKWATILNHPKAIGPTVDRAFQIACSEPCGPVYLALPREALMAEIDDTIGMGPALTPPVTLGGIDRAKAHEIVSSLADAEFPLLLTGYGGRTAKHRNQLTRLAEKLGLAVTEYRGRFNVPHEHRQHLGFNPERWVGQADVTLIVDHDVPFVPADMPVKADAKFVHIGPDPIHAGMVTWGFPADVVVPCHTADGLNDLLAAAEEYTSQNDSVTEKIQKRLPRIEEHHTKLVTGLQSTDKESGPDVITPYRVGQALTGLCPDAVLFEEAVTSGNPFAYGFHPNEKGVYMRNGGSFLGWGLSAALGAKMGDPSQTVVSVLGDGAFMFGVPTAALWLSRRESLPILILILNNACYNSVRLAARDAYPEGVQVREGFVGVSLAESPAFEMIAESCGGWGKRVERPDALVPALKEALDVVRQGRTAVVNIITQAAERPL